MESLSITLPKLEDAQENKDGLAAAGYKLVSNISSENTTIRLHLQRLYARQEFTFKKSPELKENEANITGFAIRGVAKAVKPFAKDDDRFEFASRFEDDTMFIEGKEATVGDKASDDDLIKLSSGETCVFYIPENIQGTAGLNLQDNKDYTKKSFVNSNSPCENRCTYFELTVNFDNSVAISGKVKYRLYLGLNPFNDFSVVRNHIYKMTITGKKDGIRLDYDQDWQIDNGTKINEDQFSSVVVKGIRNTGEMYIGETMKYHIVPSAELLKIYDKDFFKTCQVYLGKTMAGSTSVEKLDNIECGAIYEDTDGELYCDIKAVKQYTDTAAYLHLFNEKEKIGNICSDVSGNKTAIKVLKPHLKASKTIIAPVINGPVETITLDLVDKEGNNLLDTESGCYKFDRSMYSDLEFVKAYGGSATNEDLISNATSAELKLNGESSPHFATFTTYIRNGGSNKNLCDALSSEYTVRPNRIQSPTKGKLWAYLFHGININQPMTILSDFDIIKPSIELYDNGYNNSELRISNPSKITLNVKVLNTIIPTNEKIDEGWIAGTHTEDRDNDIQDQWYITNNIEEIRNLTETKILSKKYFKYTPLFAPNSCTVTSSQTITNYHSIEALYDSIVWNDEIQDNPAQIDVYVEALGIKAVNFEVDRVCDRQVYQQPNIELLAINKWSKTATDDVKSCSSNTQSKIFGSYCFDDLKYIGLTTPRIKVKKILNSTGYSINVDNAIGKELTFTVNITAKSSLKWKNKNSDNETRETYTKELGPYIWRTLSSGTTSNIVCPASDIDAAFIELNQNYWHHHCGAAIKSPGHSYGKMAMPEFIESTCKAVMTSSIIAVVDDDFETISYTPSGTFYWGTQEGYYPAKTPTTNPDGSSRGINKSQSGINPDNVKIATKWSGYRQETPNIIGSNPVELKGTQTAYIW